MGFLSFINHSSQINDIKSLVKNAKKIYDSFDSKTLYGDAMKKERKGK